MFELTIKSNVLNDRDTSVYINGIKQTAIPKKGILFSVEQKQECEIVFLHSEQLLPYKYWIMYLPFLPLSFLRVIIGIFTEDKNQKWYHSINPYSFVAKGKVYLNEDKFIRLGFTEAGYIKTKGTWEEPRFNCDGVDVIEWQISKEINKVSFHNQYFDYFCLKTMIGIIVMLLLGISSCIYLSSGRLALSMLTGGFMILLLVIIVYQLVTEYRRMKELLEKILTRRRISGENTYENNKCIG